MGINAALNGMVLYDGAKQGANKAGKELSIKTPPNKYDAALDNNVSVVKDDFMGNNNALNAGRSNFTSEASSLIEQMYQEKLAEEQVERDKEKEEGKPFERKPFERKPFERKPFERQGFERRNNFGNDRNNQQRRNGFNAGGFAPTNRNVGAYGEKLNTYNNDGDDNKKDYLSYAVLGSMAVGLGAYQAIKRKSITAPLNDVKNNIWPSIRKGVYEAPKKLIKSTMPGRVALKAVKEADKSVMNMERAERNLSKANRYKNKAYNAGSASQEIQQAYDMAHDSYSVGEDATKAFNEFRQANIDDFNDVEKIAYANFENNRHFFKTLVKEDFLQNGIRSLPYIAAPIAVSHAVNRNLKVDGSKLKDENGKTNNGDRIVIDVPVESLSKQADYINDVNGLTGEVVNGVRKLHHTPKWGDFFKEEMPRAAVRGISYAAIPTAAIMLTKRNLRGMGEKLDEQKLSEKDIKPGMARITIEAGKPTSTHGSDKMAKELIDDMYKEAVVGNASSIVEKSMENIIKKKDLVTPNAKQITDATKTAMSSMPVQGLKQKVRMLK